MAETSGSVRAGAPGGTGVALASSASVSLTLLTRALADAEKLKAWSLEHAALVPRLVLTLDDGATYTGRFKLKGANRPEVTVDRSGARAPTTRPVK